MRLSIVLLSYSIANSDKFSMLDECLKSLALNPTEGSELIIVDNGSTCEKSSELMRSMADVYVRLRENRGFGPGMNVGYRLATGDHVCFLNDDIVVGEKWADNLMESCGEGVACPALLPLGWLDDPVEMKIGKINAFQKEHDGYGTQKFGGFGACFVAKRSTFEATLEDGKVFDERFRIAMFEDTDLWKRMEKYGRDVVCDNRSWVYHVGNGTVGKILEFHEAYKENEAKFKEKWGL